MHAAFVMHSIVPADVDIIIWEFAINDGHKKGCQEINNGIIIWLDQIKRMWHTPPLVILAYLWDPSMRTSADRIIHDTVFRCHDHLASIYEFVVGSVNLGSYLQNLKLDFDSVGLFLADNHHPNVVGHWFLGYLLWDLATDMERIPLINRSSKASTQPHWNCNPRPMAKRRVTELLDHKYAFASWTGEKPRNEDDSNEGMLHPQLAIEQNATFLQSGKASEFRQDRKLSLLLPCCSLQERVQFDLTVVNDTRTSAIQIYSPEITTLHQLSHTILVSLLDSGGSLLGNSKSFEWVTFQSDECRVGHWFLNTWLALPEETPVAKIDICNIDPACGKEKSTSVSLMHVVLY